MLNFSKILPLRVYSQIVELMPILCVDAVIISEGKYVLVKRKNEPLKDEWWVPGGRVYKGEFMEQALKRKIQEELGIQIKPILPIGYYEEYFEENAQDNESGIHTMSVVFLCSPLDLNIKLDNQSSGWILAERLPERFVVKPF